jgi:hypothetical protein
MRKWNEIISLIKTSGAKSKFVLMAMQAKENIPVILLI